MPLIRPGEFIPKHNHSKDISGLNKMVKSDGNTSMYPQDRIEPSYTITCCEAMTDQLINDDLICILDVKPFSRIINPVTTYLQSDGGNGGMAAIKYCPFCGEKIEIIKL